MVGMYSITIVSGDEISAEIKARGIEIRVFEECSRHLSDSTLAHVKWLKKY